MEQFIDARIADRKLNAPADWAFDQEKKALMKCLKPKKGKALILPCKTKMIGYKFLHKCYGTDEHEYMDLDDPAFN